VGQRWIQIQRTIRVVGLDRNPLESNMRSVGNRTEQTQHGPAPAPPSIEDKEHTEKKVNKWIRCNKEDMKEVLWCFRYVKETTCTEKYKLAHDLWKQINRNSRRNRDAKLLLNHKNYILKNKKITDLEISEITKNIKAQMQDDPEDQTIEEESNTLKEENSEIKNRGTEQHIAKLQEDLQMMWFKVRLLQMSERQRLPKLRKKQ